MNFFERQDQAHRKTKLLLFYFVLAVAAIVCAVYGVVWWGLLYLGEEPTGWFDPEIALWTAVGVLGVVIIGSISKTVALRRGGGVVATMLGGRPVNLHTDDLAERKLINIVEEMSIASGLPVPDIYILDQERDINAFAAGHGPGDAAIGVTRGAIDQLSRDELQGVIAHEFSHLLNGDTRLNIHLMGVIFGIICIALLGRIVFEVGLRSGGLLGGGRRSGGDSKGNPFAVMFVFLIGGLALLIIGYIGVFFGNLIKAAVSRQREFLADAASVQFTRNPDGICGALAKIGKGGSRIRSVRAEEASHLYFGNGVRQPFTAMLATHPPIRDRIRAVNPRFDFSSVRKSSPEPPPLPQDAPAPRNAKEWIGDAGTIGPRHLYFATALLAALPESAKSSAHEPQGAAAMMYALLLSDDDETRQRQIQLLQTDETTRSEVANWMKQRSALDGDQRISIVDLAIPALRQMSPEQYGVFRKNIHDLVEADGQITLFEYTLQKILTRHLDRFFTNQSDPKVKFKSVVPLVKDCQILISAFAYLGHTDPAERDAAYEAGFRELLMFGKDDDHPRIDGCNLAEIDKAIDRVAEAASEVKRRVLFACSSAVMHDEEVSPHQGQLLRALADALDVPLPPFVLEHQGEKASENQA